MGHILTQCAVEAYRAYLRENERSPATIEKYLRDIGALYGFLVKEDKRGEEEKERKKDGAERKVAEAKAVDMTQAVTVDAPISATVQVDESVIEEGDDAKEVDGANREAAMNGNGTVNGKNVVSFPAAVSVDKTSLLTWREYLLQERTPGTVNGMLSAANGLFKYLGWEDCRVRFLKVQRRLFRDQQRQLSQTEYRRLLAAAEARGDERLRLLLETLCATGIRVSEVAYITLEAVRQGCAQIALKGKIRTVLLPGKLCRKLRQYAKARGITSGVIFRTRGGKPLARRQIWAQMKALCKAARVEPSKVFPHNLRHLFATVFYQACRDIVRLADVLGHSSVETTRIYLISTGEEQVKQLDRLGLVT